MLFDITYIVVSRSSCDHEGDSEIQQTEKAETSLPSTEVHTQEESSFAETDVNERTEYVGTNSTETELVPERVSPLAGKRVLVLGDSISADYYANYKKWVTVLMEEGFFSADTTNDSIHATGFVARYTGDDPNAENDFISRVTALTDKSSYDLIIVFGGINDYIQNVEMGETGGDIGTYFKPAVDYFFRYLLQNFPNAQVVVLSPLRTYNIWRNKAGGSQETGHYQTEYADYIRQVAESLNLPVLNLTEESGFCPYEEEFREKWTLIPSGYTRPDGVHPNEDYQEQFLAPMIKEFLSQLYAD